MVLQRLTPGPELTSLLLGRNACGVRPVPWSDPAVLYAVLLTGEFETGLHQLAELLRAQLSTEPLGHGARFPLEIEHELFGLLAIINVVIGWRFLR